MDERIKQLLDDLEQYIRDNWVAPEDAGLSESLALTEEEISLPGDQDSEDTSGTSGVSSTSGADGTYSKANASSTPSKSGVLFSEDKSSLSLEDLIGEVGNTFHEVLFEKISQSGMTDVEVYKRANMDRKLFSKIRSNPAYHPRKDTVLALAIALKLNLEETQDLLSRAEYALSPSSKSDVIIRYFIERREYDIHLINIALDDHGLAILE